VKLLVSFAPNYRVIDRRSEVNKCALMVICALIVICALRVISMCSEGDMCSDCGVCYEGDIYVL
jgi:hypothetical protein